MTNIRKVFKSDINNVYDRSRELSEITLLSTLYIIQKARKAYADGRPYCYLNGKELSTRDLIRLVITAAHELDHLMGQEGAVDRLVKARELSYSYKTIRGNGRSYWGDHCEAEIYENSLEGREYLRENLGKLISFYNKAGKDIVGAFNKIDSLLERYSVKPGKLLPR